MLGAAIKQPIHHRPGIRSKRLTGTAFWKWKNPSDEWRKLAGFHLRINDSYLSSQKYRVLCGGRLGAFLCFVFVFSQTGPLEGHSGPGIYHGDALTCLNFYSFGLPPQEGCEKISGEGG